MRLSKACPSSIRLVAREEIADRDGRERQGGDSGDEPLQIAARRGRDVKDVLVAELEILRSEKAFRI